MVTSINVRKAQQVADFMGGDRQKVDSAYGVSGRLAKNAGTIQRDFVQQVRRVLFVLRVIAGWGSDRRKIPGWAVWR